MNITLHFESAFARDMLVARRVDKASTCNLLSISELGTVATDFHPLTTNQSMNDLSISPLFHVQNNKNKDVKKNQYST